MDIESMKISDVWILIAEKASANKSYIEGMNISYGIELSGEEANEYTLNFSDGDFEISEGINSEVDCKLELSDKNFKKLVNGKLNTTSAFMMGKLKVKGNIGLALKLEKLLKMYFN